MEQTLPLGQYTSTIYGAIKEHRYNEAIDILLIEYQNFPRSRAALSLLAYCFYHINDFQTAAQYYELLLAICPEVDEYRIYYAQSLYKAGQYPEAIRSAVRVDGPQYSQRIKMLQAVVKYEQDELSSSKALLDQCHSDDPDVIVNYAAISYKEGKYDQARTQLTEAINTLGYQPDLALNIALCYFREVCSPSFFSITSFIPPLQKQYGPALRHIAEIIEKGVRSHPELSVGSNSDGMDVRSVGNSSVLKETCLVEAFNLKAAIEYEMRVVEPAKVASETNPAKEAMTDMPPRREDELDAVTLHNQAIIYADDDPTAAFKKLTYLISNPPYPPETFGNLLLLHCKYQNYDVAAGVLAENSHLTYKYLSQELYDYLDASIMVPTAPEEAYRYGTIISHSLSSPDLPPVWSRQKIR
jgi:tetratricopeptide repeat protein 30